MIIAVEPEAIVFESGAGVGRHDDNRVFKIDNKPLAVGESSVVQNLQELLKTSAWAFSISSTE